MRTQGINVILTTLLALAAASCKTTPPTKVGGFVPAIADQLLASAERRADLSSMRVYVSEIHATHPPESVPFTGSGAGIEHGHESDPISVELEHLFVVALAPKINLVDSEVLEKNLHLPESLVSRETPGPERMHADPTHMLVGDYSLQGDKLNVSVRLVDVGTLLIVAAARGLVPQEELGLDLRRADPSDGRKTNLPPWKIGSSTRRYTTGALDPSGSSRGGEAKDPTELAPAPTEPPGAELASRAEVEARSVVQGRSAAQPSPGAKVAPQAALPSEQTVHVDREASATPVRGMGPAAFWLSIQKARSQAGKPNPKE